MQAGRSGFHRGSPYFLADYQLTNSDNNNTNNKPNTPTRVSIADQERNVSFSDRPKYSLNIQKPESFTWLHIRLPAPTASTIRFGSTCELSTSGVTMPAAVTPATAADPRQMRRI